MADNNEYLLTCLKTFVNKNSKDGDGDFGINCKTFLFPYFNRYLYFKLNQIADSELINFLGDDFDATDILTTKPIIKDKKEAEIKRIAINYVKELIGDQFKKKSKEDKVQAVEVRKELLHLVSYLINGNDVRPASVGYTNKRGEYINPIDNKSVYMYDKAFELYNYYKRNHDGVITKADLHNKENFIPKYGENEIYNFVSWLNPSKFYSLSPQQVLVLLQNIADCYAERFKVVAPPISTAKFEKLNNGYVTYGAFYPALNEIKINKDILAQFDLAKKVGSTEYPLRLLQTIIHETRHCVQLQTGMLNSLKKSEHSANLTKANIFDKIVNSKIKTEREKYIEYLNRAEEIDARNSAIDIIKECFNKGYLNECLIGVSRIETEDKNFKSTEAQA